MAIYYITTRETIRKTYRIESDIETKDDALRVWKQLGWEDQTEEHVVEAEWCDFEVTGIEKEPE